MDALDHDFALLASSVERAVTVQRQEAADLLAAPSPQGKVLAEHLHSAYERLANRVEQRKQDFKTLPDDAAKRGAITDMRAMVEATRSLQVSFTWLDAARQPPIDQGTRYLIGFIASQLVSPLAEVTVVAATEKSYRTVIDPLTDVLAALGEDPEDDDQPRCPAILVFMPRREQSSGLLHPLIVHELGHAASKAQGITDSLLSSIPANSEICKVWKVAAASLGVEMSLSQEGRSEICAALDEDLVDSDDADDHVDTAGRYLRMQFRWWVDEAFCDAFAIQLLGPTYLYAFIAIVCTSGIDEADRQHPSARQRIALMLDQLDTIGWTTLLEESSPQIFEWASGRAEEEIEHDDPAQKFCIKALQLLAEQLRTVAANHVGALIFEPEGFAPGRRDQVARLLAARVPPAQIQDVETGERNALHRQEIVLGSWLFAIKEGGGGLEALAKAPGLPELSQLLPKALELSALANHWEGGAGDTS